MAYSYVTGANNSLNGQAASRTIAYAPAAVNNLLIVPAIAFSSVSGKTMSISDTASNSWQTASALFIADTTNFGYSKVWWALANNTTSTNITVTWSGSNVTDPLMGVEEYTGLNTTTGTIFTTGELAVNDDSSSSLTSGTGYNSGNTPTLSGNPCLVWGWSFDTALNATGSTNSVAAGSGFSGRQIYLGENTNRNGLSEDMRVTANTAVDATFTSNFSSISPVAYCLVFHEPSSSVTTHYLASLGVGG